MQVKYTTAETGGSGTDYSALADKTVVLRFTGFRRGDDGHLRVDRWLKYGYKEEAGIVKNDKDQVIADPEDGYDDFFFYQFEVLSESGNKEEQFAHLGTTMSHRVRSSGIEIVRPDEFRWYLKGATSGLIRCALACGLSAIKADQDSTFFDPAYLQPYLDRLSEPLTVAKIVEYVIEPILLEAASPDEEKGRPPRLVQAKTTGKGRSFVGFQWDSFEALEADMATALWKAIEAQREVPLDPEEEKPPFPDQPEAVQVYETGLDNDAMKAKIATAITNPGEMNGHVIPKGMWGADEEDLKDRLNWLYTPVKRVEPDFSGGGRILSEIKPETMHPLYCAVFPQVEEPATATVGL
jgi:hypothetical protein